MRVELSGQKFVFPQICACCGQEAQLTLSATASRTTGKRVVRTSSRSFDFPYCSACVAHVRAAGKASAAGLAVFGLCAILMAVIILATGNINVGIFVFIVGALGGVALWLPLRNKAKAMCTKACPCVDPAVTYLSWHGHAHSFKIRSTVYAFAFMKANQQKLINVAPQTWQWLNQGQPATQQQSAKRFIQ